MFFGVYRCHWYAVSHICSITCCATRCKQKIIYTQNRLVMLQINNETAHKMFFQIMERFDKIDRALERMNKLKDCLDGDTLLDNYDLCQLLGITKRTLARYRQKKLVTYYMIDGRTYYKASEVEAFLYQKGKSLPAKYRPQANV